MSQCPGQANIHCPSGDIAQLALYFWQPGLPKSAKGIIRLHWVRRNTYRGLFLSICGLKPENFSFAGHFRTIFRCEIEVSLNWPLDNLYYAQSICEASQTLYQIRIYIEFHRVSSKSCNNIGPKRPYSLLSIAPQVNKWSSILLPDTHTWGESSLDRSTNRTIHELMRASKKGGRINSNLRHVQWFRTNST